MSLPEPSRDLHFRAFVSSTFQDFQAERSALAIRAFPLLRQLCEEHGATFSEVDLRWGITEGESQAGRTMEICLQEVDECRPLFLALLGDRYGWIPEPWPPGIIEQFPHLEPWRGRSLTELEIRHGLLCRPGSSEWARCYFRRPGPVVDPRQEALKRAIRDSGVTVREGFQSPEELAEQVQADLAALLRTHFPAGHADNVLAQEHAAQAAAKGRARRTAGNPDERMARFDQTLRHAAAPLLLLGEPGSGRSTLLARWELAPARPLASRNILFDWLGRTFASVRDRPPSRRGVIVIGAGPLSDHLGGVLRYAAVILGASHRTGSPTESPLLTARAALVEAGRSGGFELVLDGMDRLPPPERRQLLAWLDLPCPAGVRVAVSASDPALVTEWRQRRWPIWQLSPLDGTARQSLASGFLQTFSRRLSPADLAAVTDPAPCGNPLFLRTVLNELRWHGTHETLPGLIRHYVAAPDLPGLFTRVLSRLEQDFDPGSPGLVAKTFSALWAARHGLTETELRDVAGVDGAPVTPLVWSAFRLGASEAWSRRAGLLALDRPPFRRAVEARYLPDVEAKQRAHRNLAGYFGRGPMTLRAGHELPWHLAGAGQGEALIELLCRPDYASLAWRTDRAMLQALWVRAARPPRELLDLSRWVIEQGDLLAAGGLLRLLDGPAAALKWFETAAAQATSGNAPDRARETLGALAGVLVELGDFARAVPICREHLALLRNDAPGPALGASLGTLGVALRQTGRLEEARTVHEEELQLAERAGDLALVASAHGRLGALERAAGADAAALAHFVRQSGLALQLGDHQAAAEALGNEALLLADHGRLAEALSRNDEVLAVSRRIGDVGTLSACLGTAAMIHQRLANCDAALECLQEKLTLGEQRGSRPELARTHAQLAKLYADPNLKRYHLAWQQAERASRLALEAGLTPLAEQLDLLRAELAAKLGLPPSPD